MAYTKHTWSSGEVISAANLNNLENGVANAHDLANINIANATRGQEDVNATSASNTEVASTNYVINYVNGITNGMSYNSSDAATTKTLTSLTQSNGKISAEFSDIEIPDATTSSKGLVQIGNNLSVNNGVVSATIPAANANTLGGIRIGTGLTINSDGIVSTTLPTASTDTLGGIKIGEGLSIDNGVVSTDLPTATSATLGLVKIGSGLSINTDGELSVLTNSDGTINLDALTADYGPRASGDTKTDEQYITSPFKTLHNLIQYQGQISATFQEIPDAHLASGDPENDGVAAAHGLISVEDLTLLHNMDDFLSLDNPIADTEYFFINSTTEGRKGWTTSINNFSVNGTLSINNITTTDPATQETIVQTPATLRIGKTTLNETQLQQLLALLENYGGE